MEHDETAALRAEISALKETVAKLEAKVTDLRAALDLEARSTTEHVTSVNQFLTDYLVPVFHKVFPKYAGEVRALDRVLGQEAGGKGTS